jgi:orotate phosphoribosyltransferase-like protein
MNELRWDSPPVLSLAGRNVVCIVDVVHTGDTVNRLLAALRHVGALPLGVLAVLALDSAADTVRSVPLFAFCERKSSYLLTRQAGARGSEEQPWL